MAMSNDLQPFHGGHQRRHRRFGDRICGLPPWMSGTFRALAVVLLKDPIRQRSAAEQARAAEAMIDEALRNPYGRLAADLRRLGVLPQKET
jgi:hypothetical protein